VRREKKDDASGAASGANALERAGKHGGRATRSKQRCSGICKGSGGKVVGDVEVDLAGTHRSSVGGGEFTSRRLKSRALGGKVG